MDSRGIVETEKRSAHILYIPNHLSEEVSDFPLLYQEDKMAKFKGSVWQENVIRCGEDITTAPDGQTATIRFVNLRVRLEGKNPPLVATQVASFTSPIIENATDLHVHLFISGYVFTTPGTRAILVAHLGDTTALAPLPESPSDQPILQALEATLPAGVDVLTTLFLLAERSNSGDESQVAWLEVEALDFTLGKLDSGEA